MTDTADFSDQLRTKILEDPNVVLKDDDLMRALMTANEQLAGRNVVDLRGVAMSRLEERLDRLEDTHRSVIAAAYDNLAGTNQVHRAILKLMEAPDFTSFLTILREDVAGILRIDGIRLVLEVKPNEADPTLADLDPVIVLAEPGYVDHYLARAGAAAGRKIVLRRLGDGKKSLFDTETKTLGSEALMLLDMGAGRLPALLALGSMDEDQYAPNNGTDLLTFFAGVFERSMRRWLA